MFITLCNSAALRGSCFDGREVFSLFFSAHHTPPPLEDNSKGQYKSEQAADISDVVHGLLYRLICVLSRLISVHTG